MQVEAKKKSGGGFITEDLGGGLELDPDLVVPVGEPERGVVPRRVEHLGVVRDLGRLQLLEELPSVLDHG